MLILFIIGVPTLIALYFGFRGRKDRPRTPRAFLIGALWAMGWAFFAVVLWQGIWISAQGAQGDSATIWIALYWAAISSVIWFPVLMITYVITAQRAIRQEDKGE